MTDTFDGPAGTKRFGDNAGGNYTEIEADGTVVAVGDAVVWGNLSIAMGEVKLPGVSDPSWTAYKGSYVLTFAKAADNIASFSAQMPHGYKQGSDIEFHLHLAYPDNGAGGSRWVFTHSWANMGAAFPGETTVPLTVASPEITDQHQYSEIATLSGAGKTISSILLCSIMREGTDAVNDTYDDVSYLVSMDFHYQRDTNGSRLENSK